MNTFLGKKYRKNQKQWKQNLVLNCSNNCKLPCNCKNNNYPYFSTYNTGTDGWGATTGTETLDNLNGIGIATYNQAPSLYKLVMAYFYNGKVYQNANFLVRYKGKFVPVGQVFQRRVYVYVSAV
jgi:hypothetical protein